MALRLVHNVRLSLPLGRASLRLSLCRHASSNSASHIDVDGVRHPTDKTANVTRAILDKVPRRLYKIPNHPIGILSGLISSHFARTAGFTTVDPPSPVVSVAKNFDELGFAADHPGRAASDSYYINKDTLLRTHTSAHEIETFRNPAIRDGWLLTADVYRRDEIDRSHYPVFHQMEGAKLFDPNLDVSKIEAGLVGRENALKLANVRIEDPTQVGESNPWQARHDPKVAALVLRDLKLSINELIVSLFGNLKQMDGSQGPLQVRWIEAFFPFTSPSYEVEVLWNGEWLELLGTGVIQQRTLDASDVTDKFGWAFGLGIERIAMVLFSIPDIRLFWSEDERFLAQFTAGKISTFKSYSKYPQITRDTSFWIPAGVHANDFCDIVRDVAGDLVEDVKQIDQFVHPKTQRASATYRVTYRSMDRSLTNDEVNGVHTQITRRTTEELGAEIR